MDRDAFARRVCAVQDRLYRIACGQLRSPHDREDAVQEAILRAWRMRHTLRQEEFFETWLIRILINECRNIQRAAGRTIPTDALSGTTCLPEEFSELHEAVWSLEEKLRLPVILYYIEGYGTREIAQILALPHGTVCGRLRRARGRLRDLLSKR